MRRAASRGFTLVEVLVALMVVAIALAALMTAVSGTARTSGYLRDKTLAQWIALNRIAEVRLTTNRLGQTKDTGQLVFANRTWHYDTRYFDTSVTSVQRIVVRVWAGDANSKSNPVTEAYGFLGTSVATPGGSNVDWTIGTSAAQPAAPCSAQGITPTGAPCTPTAPGATGTTGTGATTGTTGTPATPVTPVGSGGQPGAPP